MNEEMVADKGLLNFHSYEHYLDSFSNEADLVNLRSITVSRQLVQLGFRTMASVMTQPEFEQRKAAVQELLNPTSKNVFNFSDHQNITDSVLRELAERERANKYGILTVRQGTFPEAPGPA